MKPRIRTRMIKLAMVVFGNLLYALSVTLFILPSNVISCGTTGIGLVLEHLWNVPISGFVLVFNVIMLALGWLVLGKGFAMTTELSSLLYPVLLEICQQLLGDGGVTENMLLNTLFGGMGLGASLGIVMRAGASTGGMDIPPLILKKLFSIPVSATLWIFDFLIMLAQMSFHTPEDLLYGIVMILTISIVLNKVTMLGTSRTEIKIVSQKSEEIRQGILSQVDRGVTLLHSEGGFLHEPTEVVLSVVATRELHRVQNLARAIDPECFMVVTQVTEVSGRGFSFNKVYREKTE